MNPRRRRINRRTRKARALRRRVYDAARRQILEAMLLGPAVLPVERIECTVGFYPTGEPR